jgi:hypothetical protein
MKNACLSVILAGLSVGFAVPQATHPPHQPSCNWQPGPGFAPPPFGGCQPGEIQLESCATDCAECYLSDIKAAEDAACDALWSARDWYAFDVQQCSLDYDNCIAGVGGATSCGAARDACMAAALSLYMNFTAQINATLSLAHANAIQAYLQCRESCCVQAVHVPSILPGGHKTGDLPPRLEKKPLPPM